MRQFHMHSAIRTGLAILGAISYPSLLLLVLGASFSPFNPISTWGLSAEHGELDLDHWSHFIGAIVAAFPYVISLRLHTCTVARSVLLASPVIAALPYAVQPTHSFAASDSWLANYTWQVAAVEVLLAPVFVTAIVATLAWLWARTR